MFIIQTMHNRTATKSYSGNAWDKASLREKHKDEYTDPQEASYLAYMLNFYSDKKLVVYKKLGGL